MNGYECPCCDEFIAIDKSMRDCPHCKASVADQREEREIQRRADNLKSRLLRLLTGDDA